MSPERRRLLLGGAVAVAAAALYLSLADDEPEVAAVVAQGPERLPEPSAPVAAPVEPEAAQADLSALRLHGLTATGAIIASAATGQRLVRLGREVVPGVTLTEVRQQYAVLTTKAGLFELGFLGGAEAAAPAATAAAANPGQTVTRAPARRTEVLQYRFGLAPRRADGRINGFALRPGAEMPLLQRAGLRAGDVLVGVNGQTFDSEEKVMELATEIAGAYTAEFEFERGGRRMRASLPVNPRS